MGPAQVLRAEERGRRGDESREDGTDHEVHAEAERDLVDTREDADNGNARDEDPSEEREDRERERRIGGSLRDQDGDIGRGIGGRIAPPPTQPPEDRPEKGEGGTRGGDGPGDNGPLEVGARPEHRRGGDVRQEVQRTVAHEQAQHREVHDEDQRREPAEPLRPRAQAAISVEPGSQGPPR